MNPEIRTARLELDNYECQLSKLFGIAHLSGKLCSEDLEVHHKTYEHELVTDLITVCIRCHNILTDAIRRERYSQRRQDGNRDIDFQDSRDDTIVDAQRAISRPVKQVDTGQQGNQCQEEENRCRLSGNGTSGVVRQSLLREQRTLHSSLRIRGHVDRARGSSEKTEEG